MFWQASGEIMTLLFFGYIGTSVGLGLGLYAALPKKKKPLGRRLALLMVGSFLIGFVGIYQLENIQIEGLFFGLLTGVVQAAVVHYLIAKIFGPLLFGRLWCGWACWTVMVLDLLPFQRSSGRLPVAIRMATGDKTLRRRAAELGRKIRAEDGVAKASRSSNFILRPFK